MRYPVVIHKDPDSDYGVTVPDLPGCFSAGVSVDEALEEVAEVIACHYRRINHPGLITAATIEYMAACAEGLSESKTAVVQ